MQRTRRIHPKTWYALIFYLVLPVTVLNLLMVLYPELARGRFIRMIYCDLAIGPIVVMLTHITQRYRPGTLKRLYLNIGCVLSTLLWLYGVLGGSLTITNYWHEYPFHITYTNYVLLILFAAGLNITYYILEYRSQRTQPSQTPSNSDYWYPPLENYHASSEHGSPGRKHFTFHRDRHNTS